MTAERAEKTLADRVADLEAIVASLVAGQRVNDEPVDPSRALHRAFVAQIRERERQA